MSKIVSNMANIAMTLGLTSPPIIEEKGPKFTPSAKPPHKVIVKKRKKRRIQKESRKLNRTH